MATIEIHIDQAYPILISVSAETTVIGEEGTRRSVLRETWNSDPITAFQRVKKLASDLGQGTLIVVSGNQAMDLADLLIASRARKSPKDRQPEYRVHASNGESTTRMV